MNYSMAVYQFSVIDLCLAETLGTAKLVQRNPVRGSYGLESGLLHLWSQQRVSEGDE